jgi:heme exporter protein C
VIKFSVDWWNTLHQGESIFRRGGPTIAAVYLVPLFLMGAGYAAAFGALWLTRTRAEVRRRRAAGLALRAAL